MQCRKIFFALYYILKSTAGSRGRRGQGPDARGQGIVDRCNEMVYKQTLDNYHRVLDITNSEHVKEQVQILKKQVKDKQYESG